MKRALATTALAAMIGLAIGCGAPPSIAPPAAPADAPVKREVANKPAPKTDPIMRKSIDNTMALLTETRGLSIKREVNGKLLGRDAVIDLMMAKAKRELPPEVLTAQGHLMRGLGMIDVDYDFVAGIFGMLRNNVAGFYEQHGEWMYLLDDLPAEAKTETLVHELEHAIQDQHFDLKKMLKHRPGATDAVTAAHALCEGDATSATFDIVYADRGGSFAFSERMLRVALVMSVAMTEGGATPRVLQSALVAPYIDGFSFVQKLRKRDGGGWTQVNEALRNLPASTEQLLHLDKFDAREPPIIVPQVPLPAAGWKRMDADVMGEQGTRMSFEQWGSNDDAKIAAAGWGGDRYVVARKRDEIAVGWHLVFDDENEAQQAWALLDAKLPGCQERDKLGPLAWKRRGDAIAMVAGPFRISQDLKHAQSTSECSAAAAWLDAILATR